MGIKLRVKDIQMLEDCSERTAKRRMKHIRDTLAKPIGELVTTQDYAKHTNQPLELIHKSLSRLAK